MPTPDETAAAESPAGDGSSAGDGLLLYTGNPITAEEEAQFIETAGKTLLGPKVLKGSVEGARPKSASPVTLTPANFAVAGMHGIACAPRGYISAEDFLWFNSGTWDSKGSMYDQSNLTLCINIDRQNPETLFTVFFRVEVDAPQPPKFDIIYQSQPAQTVSGKQGPNNFAYGFTCTNSDMAFVRLYCSTQWSFKSAKLISTNY